MKIDKINRSPTKVERVFKINNAKMPKNKHINPNNLPNTLLFKITHKTKGNLMSKLAAITFLFP